MAEELIISISGMRGIVGENLTPVIAVEYGCAFGVYLKSRAGNKKFSVCIGTDSRPSGAMLKSAVITGLCSVGVNVVDLGIVTTPCVGIMLRHLECEGGVIITASHNPVQYNGIKLLLSDGVAPPVGESEKIKKYYFDKCFSFVESVNCGKVCSEERTDDVHIGKILPLLDKQKISAKKMKVVLDSVNGAGGRITKKLLAELGCDVVAINDSPTGLFAHTPEPIAENLGGLCEIVKKEKADIGFAQDPDADRLAIVDEKGCYIGEEYTLALAAKYIFSVKKGKAATNLSTSRMLNDIAEGAGGEVIRTAVGEANVAAAMLEHKCIIGGEGNGGVIDLRVGPVRDSLVGISFVLQLMAQTDKSVSELVNEISRYFVRKDKFAVDKVHAQQIMESARKVFADAKVDTTDGYRFDFDDGWVHLRMSNTEPVMRIIIEAEEESAEQKYFDMILKIRKDIA